MASTVFMVLVALVGLVMYAFYATCDPITDEKIKKSDQVTTVRARNGIRNYK